VPEEAAMVRRIFALYLEHGSPSDHGEGLERRGADHATLDQQQGLRSRRPWTTYHRQPHPDEPDYIGKIAHTRGSHLPNAKDRGQTEVWPGLHEPIIDAGDVGPRAGADGCAP
jgi:hypothetical protein